jgi:release factor glutamine methyltransferase
MFYVNLGQRAAVSILWRTMRMTLREELEKGTSKLAAGPHPERARRDAELLLLHAAKLDRAALLARWNEPLLHSTQFQALIERRRTGEPIQYIVGEAEFYGLPFRVSPDVLIPRPETEHLVEKALQAATGFVTPRVVDIGTGSGAIAVTLAHLLPQAAVTAIDISEAALDGSRKNAEGNGVAGRIRFLQGDLLGAVAGEQFEMVVSNPPYVPLIDRDSLSVEVREHEPGLALFAGNDGLKIYRRLIPQAYEVLVPGGFLALEIGYGQGPAVGGLLLNSQFEKIEFAPDLQGIPRVACGWRSV